MKKYTAIQFKDVSYHVKDTVILKNISGEIIPGKITTLVGPSGSGKSTLLKLCNGLISPTSGEIFIAGKAINQFDFSALRRKVGIALQNAPMIPGTVYDNLALPLRLQEKVLSYEAAEEQLQFVGLSKKLLKEDAYNLSGGEKQRVSIARTLLNKSSILLLDEITSALDTNATAEIESLIFKLNQEHGVTIIWVTHQLEQAARVADYVWVMQAGELVKVGKKDIIRSASSINDLFNMAGEHK